MTPNDFDPESADMSDFFRNFVVRYFPFKEMYRLVKHFIRYPFVRLAVFYLITSTLNRFDPISDRFGGYFSLLEKYRKNKWQ